MKTYMPLNGFRWSRYSGSAINNIPQTDVLGRAGGMTLMWYWVMVMPKTARMYILMDRCFRGLIHIPFR